MTAYSGLPPFTQDWVRLIGLPTYAASGFYIYIYTIVDLGHRSDHEDTIYIYIYFQTCLSRAISSSNLPHKEMRWVSQWTSCIACHLAIYYTYISSVPIYRYGHKSLEIWSCHAVIGWDFQLLQSIYICIKTHLSETHPKTLPCCLHEQGFGARTWRTWSSLRELETYGELSGQTPTHALLWICATWRVRGRLWTFCPTVVLRSTLRFVYICMHWNCLDSRGIWMHICVFIHVFFLKPRLAIWLILNCRENNFFCLFATCCSSWVHVNRGTSRRSCLLPEGNVGLGYIERANQMVSRMHVLVQELEFSSFNPQTYIYIYTYIYILWNAMCGVI